MTILDLFYCFAGVWRCQALPGRVRAAEAVPEAVRRRPEDPGQEEEGAGEGGDQAQGVGGDQGAHQVSSCLAFRGLFTEIFKLTIVGQGDCLGEVNRTCQ